MDEVNQLWAPEKIYNEPSAVRINDKFHCLSVLERMPSRIGYEQLRPFVTSGEDTKPNFSIFINPLTRQEAQNKILREVGEIRSEVGTENNENRADKLVTKLDKLRRLKDDIVNENLNLFNFSLIIDVEGSSMEEVTRKEKQVEEFFSNFEWANLKFKMKRAIRSLFPLGTNYTEKSVPAHTDNVLAFFPFISKHTIEPNGIYLGRDMYTGAPFAINIWEKGHYDRLVFGQKGSGKSFLTKLMIIREKLKNPDLPVMILDPVETPDGGGEYGDLVEVLGGEIVKLSTHGTENVINPLDPTLSASIDEAVDDAITLFSTTFDMTDEEKGLLNTCLSRLYNKCTSYDEKGELVIEKEPTISDMVEELESGPGEGEEDIGAFSMGAPPGANEGVNKESNIVERLKLKLRPYIDGAYSILDNQTNVELDKDVVSFDVSTVSESHRPFFMTLVLKYIWRETAKSFEPKMVIGDEAQLLMDLKMTAEFLERYVRVVRRYHASTVLITQSAMDFMDNSHGEKIMENTMMHFLLYHEHVKDELKEFYQLSNQEADLISTPKIGRSFIKVGNERAFVNIDATEAEHEIITTDPNEVREKFDME